MKKRGSSTEEEKEEKYTNSVFESLISLHGGFDVKKKEPSHRDGWLWSIRETWATFWRNITGKKTRAPFNYTFDTFELTKSYVSCESINVSDIGDVILIPPIYDLIMYKLMMFGMDTLTAVKFTLLPVILNKLGLRLNPALGFTISPPENTYQYYDLQHGSTVANKTYTDNYEASDFNEIKTNKKNIFLNTRNYCIAARLKQPMGYFISNNYEHTIPLSPKLHEVLSILQICYGNYIDFPPYEQTESHLTIRYPKGYDLMHCVFFIAYTLLNLYMTDNEPVKPSLHIFIIETLIAHLENEKSTPKVSIHSDLMPEPIEISTIVEKMNLSNEAIKNYTFTQDPFLIFKPHYEYFKNLQLTYNCDSASESKFCNFPEESDSMNMLRDEPESLIQQLRNLSAPRYELTPTQTAILTRKSTASSKIYKHGSRKMSAIEEPSKFTVVNNSSESHPPTKTETIALFRTNKKDVYDWIMLNPHILKIKDINANCSVALDTNTGKSVRVTEKPQGVAFGKKRSRTKSNRKKYKKSRKNKRV